MQLFGSLQHMVWQMNILYTNYIKLGNLQHK